MKKIKVGIGFDAHKFEKSNNDNHIILCGIKIPSEFSIQAHSDGDVALHAITDAILGAIGQDDIGFHFPPTDNKWKGVTSEIFVKHALKLVKEAGGKINNVDITIIAETPKITPYRAELRKNLAMILSMNESDVNIKATTTEKMGFTGRKEGIACQALATVEINEK